MKIINIHKRVVDRPKEKIGELLDTLSSKNDRIWPAGKWPPMRLKAGLQEGSAGGHGPIRYNVQKYQPGELIQFEFTNPKGFQGIHRFEITALTDRQTELKHIIDMNASGTDLLSWSVAIRWLHDALIEDAFDKVENYFSEEKKKTEWSFWVKLLRKVLGPKKSKSHRSPSQ